MPNNRALSLLALLVLLAGAAIGATFYFGRADLPVAPPIAAPEAVGEAGLQHGEVGALGAVAATGSDTVREAAGDLGAGTAGVPSIVGRLVGEDAQPIADAEVHCLPGGAFLAGFEDFDPSEADLFDPSAWTERLRQQDRERVTVRSDFDGRFRVRAPGTARNVSLRVLARGHKVLDRSAPRPTNGDSDLGELTLQSGAVIAGRVVDPRGNPIEGARVTRMLEVEQNFGSFDFVMPGAEVMDNLRAGESGVTDANGRFELAHVDAGDFMLRARHEDHPTARSGTLSVAKGQTLADVLVTMQGGATIRGVVLGVPEDVKNVRVMAAARREARGGEAASGILGVFGDASELMGEMGMPFGERQVDLAADGSFELRGLELGLTYRLWAVQQGRGFTGGGQCSQRLDVASGSSGIELRYDAGVTVTFVVVDEAAGQPVEHLWVRERLRGGGGMADLMAFAPGGMGGGRSKHYPEGRVTIANLRPKQGQTLQLTLDAIGHAQLERKDIVLPSSGNHDLGTLRMAKNPVLQVTVLDADTAAPIGKAQVHLQEQRDSGGDPFARMGRMGRMSGRSNPSSAQTDAAGQCTVNALVDAVGQLEVSHRGYAPATVVVPAPTGAVAEQTVRLLLGGSVEVTVLGPDREPLGNVSVEQRTPSGGEDRKRTDDKGVARFEHQVPGAHQFRLADDQGAMQVAFAMAGRARRNGEAPTEPDAGWTSVEVADRSTATLTLEKAATARLRGVVRENGLPLAGARIAFRQGAPTAGAGAEVEGMMANVFEQIGQGNKQQAKSGDDGAFELAELPPGTHHLRVTHKDRAMPNDFVVTLVLGDNRKDVELDMTTLRGVVLDPAGNPVDGARVSVKVDTADGMPDVAGMVEGMMPGMNLGGSSLRTDAVGAFELRGVQPDVGLTVQATARGFAPASAVATVPQGQTVSGIEVRLIAAGKVNVTVAAGAGPFAAVSARYVGEDGASVPPVMQMLRRGKGTLSGMRPGTWEVEYRGMPTPGQAQGEEQTRKRTVEVRAGETVDVDF